jgi:hypothetical protein
VCHAVREPGSKVTLAPETRAGAGAWNKGSMRTVPVNQSAGPLLDGCEPGLLISIYYARYRTARKGANRTIFQKITLAVTLTVSEDKGAMTRRLISSLLACAFAFAVTGCKIMSPSSSSMEYKAVTCAGDGPDVENEINSMTKQGWHFVSMSSGGGDVTHYPVAILVFKKH